MCLSGKYKDTLTFLREINRFNFTDGFVIKFFSL